MKKTQPPPSLQVKWSVPYIDMTYNIGAMTVNTQFILRGLETGERRTSASLSIRFEPSHINSIFTVKAPILYLSNVI